MSKRTRAELLEYLNTFINRVETGRVEIRLWKSINDVAMEKPENLNVFGGDARFWNTVNRSLLNSNIINLNKLVDSHGDSFNPFSLLKLFVNNTDELTVSKFRDYQTAHNNLPNDENYLSSKGDITKKDLQKLKSHIQNIKDIWDTKYKKLRNKVVAHTDRTDFLEPQDFNKSVDIDEFITFWDDIASILLALDDALLNQKVGDPALKSGLPIKPVEKEFASFMKRYLEANLQEISDN